MFQQDKTKMYDRTRQDIRNGWFDSILKTNLANSKVKKRKLKLETSFGKFFTCGERLAGLAEKDVDHRPESIDPNEDPS
jgi:hypothetical protein